MRTFRLYLVAGILILPLLIHNCVIRDRYAEYKISSPLVWSPDGKQIAFIGLHGRDKEPFLNWEIYRVNVNGTGLTRLTNDSEKDSDPVWYADSKRIMFASNRDLNDKQNEGTENCCGDIYTMNDDGSDLRQITQKLDSPQSLNISPTNNKIAFASDGEIYSIAPDGSNFVKLVSRGKNQGETIYNYSPIWSPDGKSIAFSGKGISIIKLGRSPAIQITYDSETYGPVWSVNGKQIAYTRGIYTGDAKRGTVLSEVWIANADGSGKPQKLADGDSPVWLPDGKRIAFGCSAKPDRDGSEQRFICLMDRDGSNIIKLKPKIGFFALAPDGKKVAFTSDSHSINRLYVMNIDGSGLLQLVGKPEQ
ncbi:MAG: hypothetical protein ACRC62_27055 [Microcoleus sp.]